MTGVRALAALWVFVYHAWLASGAKPVVIPLGTWQADLTPWFAFGWLGLMAGIYWDLGEPGTPGRG